MSIDSATKVLDNLVNNLKTDIPVILKEGSIGYGNYLIKRAKNGIWDLFLIGKRFKLHIDSFNLKIIALISARYHKQNQIMQMAKLKDLDQKYWASYSDSLIFHKRYKESKDKFKKDLVLWRYELSKERAEQYKNKIIQAYSFF